MIEHFGFIYPDPQKIVLGVFISPSFDKTQILLQFVVSILCHGNKARAILLYEATKKVQGKKNYCKGLPLTYFFVVEKVPEIVHFFSKCLI